MTETSSSLNKVNSARLVDVMNLGEKPERIWRPEELGAVFRHQMAAPVSVDLSAADPAVSGKLRVLTDANNLLLKSFSDLFQHPQPPVELLRMVKDFAKMNRDRLDSFLPNEVATALYFLSIAAAVVRLGQRISVLPDAELRRGFAWVLGQAWIDEPAHGLLEAAIGLLTATGTA